MWNAAFLLTPAINTEIFTLFHGRTDMLTEVLKTSAHLLKVCYKALVTKCFLNVFYNKINNTE